MIFKKEVAERREEGRSEVHNRSRTGGLSMLAQGCKFQGKIFLHGDARIGGEVTGSVISSAVLTVEQSAVVLGDINGTHVLLNGRVEGNVVASEVLRLSPTCVVTGDLCAKRLIVEDGATIDGRVTKLGQNGEAKVGTLPIAVAASAAVAGADAKKSSSQGPKMSRSA